MIIMVEDINYKKKSNSNKICIDVNPNYPIADQKIFQSNLLWKLTLGFLVVGYIIAVLIHFFVITIIGERFGTIVLVIIFMSIATFYIFANFGNS